MTIVSNHRLILSKSSTVINYLCANKSDTQLKPVLYFYFNHDDANRQTLVNMLRAIILQICEQDPALLDILYQVYKRTGTYHVGATDTDINTILGSILNRKSRLYLILDGLDESQDQTSILDWIEHAAKDSSNPFHVLIFSRFESQLKGYLEPLSWKHVSLNDLHDQVRLDISIYVSHGLQNDKSFSAWMPEDSKEMVREVLASKAGGM